MEEREVDSPYKLGIRIRSLPLLIGVSGVVYNFVFWYVLTLKVLNFRKFTSYCSLKPLWSGMGEVVSARTSPTLHPQSPPTVHQLPRLAL